jgi:DNA-binding transcriptional ArsR family regulator
MTEKEFRAARLLSCLGNPIRFRIVLLLDRAPATPAQLAAELRRTVPRISHHLAILRAADIVRFKVREGQHMYWLKDDTAAEVCRHAIALGTALRSKTA